MPLDSLESAKRIKKEMWMKRSSFLGIEEYTNGNAGYEHGKYSLGGKKREIYFDGLIVHFFLP